MPISGLPLGKSERACGLSTLRNGDTSFCTLHVPSTGARRSVLHWVQEVRKGSWSTMSSSTSTTSSRIGSSPPSCPVCLNLCLLILTDTWVVLCVCESSLSTSSIHVEDPKENLEETPGGKNNPRTPVQEGKNREGKPGGKSKGQP